MIVPPTSEISHHHKVTNITVTLGTVCRTLTSPSHQWLMKMVTRLAPWTGLWCSVTHTLTDWCKIRSKLKTGFVIKQKVLKCTDLSQLTDWQPKVRDLNLLEIRSLVKRSLRGKKSEVIKTAVFWTTDQFEIRFRNETRKLFRLWVKRKIQEKYT